MRKFIIFINIIKNIAEISKKRSVKIKSFELLIFLNIILIFFPFSTSFSFTDSYADWYGIGFITKSSIGDYFYNLAGDDDLVKNVLNSLIYKYMFEYNVNPKLLSPLTGGITFYKSLSDFIPMDLKYASIGLDYELLLKLFGANTPNSSSQSSQSNSSVSSVQYAVNFGIGGSLGLNLESVQLLVGNSNLSSDFTKNELKHVNTIYCLNFLSGLKFYVEMPGNSINFPSIMYTFTYNFGITIYGPFLPNFERVTFQDSEPKKTFTGMKHAVLLKFYF